MKIDKARFILYDGEGLSKKIYDWDVPSDLLELAKRYKKTFVGIGHWEGSNEKFVCIATPNTITYISKELFRKIRKAWCLDGIQYVKHLESKCNIAKKKGEMNNEI